MFAYLALELLPGVGEDLADAGHVDFFALHLLGDPVLQATEVDITHRSIALAGTQQRVLLRALGHPAELALSVGLLSFSLRVSGILGSLQVQLLR